VRRELRDVRMEFRSTHRVGVELTSKLADVAGNVEDLAFYLTPDADEDEGAGSSGGAGGSGEAPEGAPEEGPEEGTGE
jgi:hypothetical protein